MQTEREPSRFCWAEAIAVVAALLTVVLAPLFCQRAHAAAATPPPTASLRLNAPTGYSIDFVEAGGSITPVGPKLVTEATAAPGSPVTVRGWAVDSVNSSSPSSVEIQIDDVSRVRAELGIRDDIARVFRNVAFEESGFTVIIPPAALPPGNHVLRLLIGDARRTGYYVAPNVINVRVP
jgi:hypothetical protein